MMATLETTARLPAERERMLALGAALVTVTLWASAFVGIRDAARDFSPGALALGRLTIASLALGLIVLVRREPLPSRRDLGVIAFVGVFWFGIYNLALIEAEQRVDAGTAAMLVNIGPILIAVLAGRSLSPASSSSAARPRAAGSHRAGARSSVSSRRSGMPSASSPKSRCSRACRRSR
jgi:threonine/homoserine efflux transporter RhtA